MTLFTLLVAVAAQGQTPDLPRATASHKDKAVVSDAGTGTGTAPNGDKWVVHDAPGGTAPNGDKWVVHDVPGGTKPNGDKRVVTDVPR